MQNLTIAQMLTTHSTGTIGTSKTVKYEYQTTSEMIQNYFKILDEENYQLIFLLNKQQVSKSQHFPFHAFGSICPELNNIEACKRRQKEKVDEVFNRTPQSCRIDYDNLEVIYEGNYSISKQCSLVFYSAYRDVLPLSVFKSFLINFEDKKCSDYRRLLCLYDLKVPLPKARKQSLVLPG